jgi:type I restriction enzyme S subunit
MVPEWQTATVAELQRKGILLVEDGNHGEYRPRPGEFVEQGVAFIRAADIDDGRILFDSASKINEQARQRITKGIGAPGDVLLSHKGTVGKVALVPDDAPPFVCSPQTTFWRTLDPEVLDRKYLCAFLRSPSFQAQLAARAGETDMAPYVSLTSQRGLSVFLPPIQEQRFIARILGTLDDRIELSHMVNRTLEAIGRAVFKHWFVDFEFPNEESNPYRSSRGQIIRNEELGREIPKEWRTGTLRDVLSELDSGSRPKGGISTYLKGIPSIGAESILGVGNYNYSSTKYVPPDFYGNLKKGIVRDGDVLLYKDGAQIGRKSLFMAGFPFDTCCVNEHVFILRSNSRINQTYLFFWLDQTWMTEEIRNLNANSAQPGINKEGVYSLKIIIPSEKVLRDFEVIVKPLVAKICKNSLRNRTLSCLRDALLPKLMSGKITVPTTKANAEAQ